MKHQIQLPFFTLLLLISFASVNAVLFTPALPHIAFDFHVNADIAQQTISWFMVGYAIGQLIYGPLANRFGRKPALFMGVGLQIISSLLCVLAGFIHAWWLLVLARFLLALGSGVGLKMTFTLVNECYEAKVASQKISYLLLAFAIAPGLGVALGGVLNSRYGWESCFYAGALYGACLLILIMRLPETQQRIDFNALKWNHLKFGYLNAFKNKQLVASGLLMGVSTSFVYVFAAIAPFVAINLFNMSSSQYGFANIIPSIGLVVGSLISAFLIKNYSLKSIIRMGIAITSFGTIIMFITMLMHFPWLWSLFLPMIIIYFGLCCILANASTIGMTNVQDKAHASAVMNFINMGSATWVVLALCLFPVTKLLLPGIYIILCIVMIGVFYWEHNPSQIDK